MIRQPPQPPSRPPDPRQRHDRLRDRPEVRALAQPTSLILGVGATWTTLTAPHGPALMWPIAAWLWLTTAITIRRAATTKRATRIK